uniref:Uncharacterized protein n=1 Tax=Anguilla anguilla TaxID=7936 RepID=A0A0E9XFV1_ANGAN
MHLLKSKISKMSNPPTCKIFDSTMICSKKKKKKKLLTS